MKLTVTSRITGLTRFIFQGEHVHATIVLGPDLAIGADDDSMLAPADPAHPVWLVFVQPDGRRADLSLTRDEADQLLEALAEAVAVQAVRCEHAQQAVVGVLAADAANGVAEVGCHNWCVLAPDHDGACGRGVDADGNVVGPCRQPGHFEVSLDEAGLAAIAAGAGQSVEEAREHMAVLILDGYLTEVPEAPNTYRLTVPEGDR